MTTKSYYNRGEAAELHKRFCGERLLMCGGAGLPWWKVWNMWKVLEDREG